MKIKKQKDIEYPSTIIARASEKGGRVYWTGNEWSHDMQKAKSYLRAKAIDRSRRLKRSFIITTGFRH